MLDIRQVSPDFAVAPQIAVADVPAIAAAGFVRLINNRPDGEDYNQPASADVRAAARAAGLDYVEAPFVGQPTAGAVKAVMLSTGRTLAFCRSGTRSTTAWAFGRASAGDALRDIVAGAAEAGYDLRPLADLLRQLGAR